MQFAGIRGFEIAEDEAAKMTASERLLLRVAIRAQLRNTVANATIADDFWRSSFSDHQLRSIAAVHGVTL